MKRFLLLGLAPCVLAACGDNISNKHVDAAVGMDTKSIDAPIPATHSGTITMFDIRLKNMGGAGVDGYGVQIGVSFTDVSAYPDPIMEEGPGLTDGCKLWEFTPVQLTTVVAGVNEGEVQITDLDSSPLFPPCIYTAGVGYSCPDLASSGNTLAAAIAPAGANLSSFTVAAPMFSSEDVGRYIKFSGTGTALDGNAFPIVAAPAATTIVFAGLSTTIPSVPAGAYTTLAGVGPMPGATATTFFTDDEQLSVQKMASTHFDAFPLNTGFVGSAGIGDDFTLGTMAGKVLPAAVPTDGSAFTVGCDTTGDCGTSVGTILSIVTTDGSIAGLSPFGFPDPAAKRVQIQCVRIGVESITVPAAFSGYLTNAMSGTTRIRTTFIRSNQATVVNATGPQNTVNMGGGHGEVGFTTPP